MKKKHSNNLLRAALLVIFVVAGVLFIVFLKRSSDRPLMPDGRFSDSLQRVAHPDTTLDASAFHPDDDTVVASLPDTVGMDLRIPSEAGYEDGYLAGLDDGAAGEERASYDDSSRFPHESQRKNYAEQYAVGYADGYADGKQGKQFGIHGN